MVVSKIQKSTKRQEKRLAKDHLKTMTKNSGSHKLRTTRRIVKYGAASFLRNVWLSAAATLVMTITLLIIFLTFVASIILSNTADTIRDKIDITIFFKPETSENILKEMKQTLDASDNVKQTKISTSEQEYQLTLAENADKKELSSMLKDKKMRDKILSAIPSTIRIKLHDINNIDSVRRIVENDPQFIKYRNQEQAPSYDVDQAKIDTIRSWANIAKNGGIALGVIFLIISVLVIFNTIRMAIFSRREEIYMMKLVGADSAFIRGPFLVEAQICGIISGVIASLAGFFGFKLVAPRLADYGIDVTTVSKILQSEWLVAVFAALILLGMIIGSVSARLAMRRYLR